MGVHLILWILATVVVSFQSLGLAYQLQCYKFVQNFDSDCGVGIRPCDNYLPSESAANQYLGRMKALTAFGVSLLSLHFILFIMACIETDRRTRQDKKIMYLMAAPGTADGRMYYTRLDHQPQGNRGSAFAP